MGKTELLKIAIVLSLETILAYQDKMQECLNKSVDERQREYLRGYIEGLRQVRMILEYLKGLTTEERTNENG